MKTKRTTTKKGLGNPAVMAALSSEAGQKAIDSANARADAAAKAASNIAEDVIPFVVKSLFIGGAIWYAVRLYTKRFVKMGTNPNYPAANVSDGQAAARAAAMYEAMYGFGANAELVGEQLAGLNYNGWVKVYNAFGNKKGANILGDEMTLVEWLNDQFDEDQLQELRFVLPGVF